MGKRWKRLWRDRSGEGYVDMVVLVLCGMLVLALCVQVLPVLSLIHISEPTRP